MKKDYSYGVIPLKYFNNEWKIFLIQHHAGHWSFPKGHAEAGESPQEAAERELTEETNLRVVNYFTLIPFEETYFFTFNHEKIHKKVSYFAAIVEGEPKLQEIEIKEGRWCSVGEAYEIMTFSQGKALCQKIQKLLENY